MLLLREGDGLFLFEHDNGLRDDRVFSDLFSGSGLTLLLREADALLLSERDNGL